MLCREADLLKLVVVGYVHLLDAGVNRNVSMQPRPAILDQQRPAEQPAEEQRSHVPSLSSRFSSETVDASAPVLRTARALGGVPCDPGFGLGKGGGAFVLLGRQVLRRVDAWDGGTKVSCARLRWAGMPAAFT